MKKINFKLNIDWKSKIADLLIVIIGITIAFKLNTWNETVKIQAEIDDYIISFKEEVNSNEANLIQAIEFSKKTKLDIDTLKQLLLSKSNDEERIKNLASSMMALTDFSASVTTMENIKSSGEFELIKDSELRSLLISSYSKFELSDNLEKYLIEYVNKYITPFFFENVRFRDFSSINSNFLSNPKFENMVIGYEILLTQQINGYQETIEEIRKLKDKLTTVSSNKNIKSN